MSGRLIQVQGTDLISVEQRSGEQSNASVIVHVSEKDIIKLMVGELEEWARWAVIEIWSKHLAIKEDKEIDVRELESDTKLLGHLNYVIDFFGGEEQKIPEEAGESPSCIPC